MSADEMIDKLWDASQRIAMQIAALPLELRNEAYEATEEAMRDTAKLLDMEHHNVPKFLSLQLQLIREVVARIDLGGAPSGGHA